MHSISIQNLPPFIQTLSRHLQNAGGQTYLVGGTVPDLLQGRAPQDWDLAVRDMSVDVVLQKTSQWGAKSVGKQFAALRFKSRLCDGLAVDLKVSSEDSLTGMLLHCDFTMNAMAFDIQSGGLCDPYGGQQDLQEGLLRVVHPATFVVDPLRTYRAMQLLARKADSVTPASLALMQGLQIMHPEIAVERVQGEFKKLMLTGQTPSKSLNFLRQSLALQWYPELQNLIDCPLKIDGQDVQAWEHTLQGLDLAASARASVAVQDKEAFMFAVLCCDLAEKQMNQDYPQRFQKGPDYAAVKRKQILRRACQDLLYKLTPAKKIRERSLELVMSLTNQAQSPSKIVQELLISQSGTSVNLRG